MFKRLSLTTGLRSSNSSSKVKCKNRGVLRKGGKRLKSVLNDNNNDEDDLDDDEIDSFAGVKVISGNRSSSISLPYPHHHHPSSSSQPLNVVKMGFNQVTYGDSKETLHSSSFGLGNGHGLDQDRNGPRVVPGIIASAGRGSNKIAKVFSHGSSLANEGFQEPSDETESKHQESKPIITTISESAEAKDDEERFYLNRKRREMKRKHLKSHQNADKYGKSIVKNWSFVFDPSGRLCYIWSFIVSLAFLYNFWIIIYRISFNEINSSTVALWLSFDILADIVYIVDILINFRICYMEEGVLQTNSKKIRQYYMNSTFFYIDCLCLLPLDFLYLSIGFNSVLRGFRLVKIYKFWSFLDRTERHINYPNVFRTLSLVHYILVIFHWNACFYYLLAKGKNFSASDWLIDPKDERLCSDVECDYLHAFYWSVLALTTIGDLPKPRTKSEYSFIIVELLLGLFLLATVIGHVANIVTNVSSAQKEFQKKLDSVKAYMRMRRVPEHLKIKVIKWFDYLWMTQKSSDEEKSVQFLPAKLKAEIAIHVHLDTLKRVEIFQNTEAGFLCALVLRLRPILFSPGDYVCRKGEVGKEMYIVNRGKLQVVNDNGVCVLATLRAGSYFGEISILNMGTAGNRRTASVKSVGYSDLFCLSKEDLWDVLKDYPAARVRLEAIAQKRLEKYKREPLTKISRGRSKSSPGFQVKPEARLKLSDENNSLEMTQFENVLLTKKDEEKFVNSVKEEDEKADYAQENELTKEKMVNITCTPPTPQQNLTNYLLESQMHEDLGHLPSPSSHFSSSPPHTFCHVPSASLSRQYHLISPTHSASHLVLAPTSFSFTPSDDETIPSQEKLLNEIERLKSRLYQFERENVSLNYKLSQQQWEVEERLKGIEMKFITKDDHLSSQDDENMMIQLDVFDSSEDDESEKNKESII